MSPDLVIFSSEYLEIAKKYRSFEIPFIMVKRGDEEELSAESFNNLTYLGDPLLEEQLVSAVNKLLHGNNRQKEIEKKVPESGGDSIEKEIDKIEKDNMGIDRNVRKKILIADDDENARILARVLLGNKYEVSEVNNGQALVDKAEGINPDLIISDIVMPGLSGWRAIGKLRENPLLKYIPIIFYSSLLKDLDLYHALKPPGPSAFLYKPYKTKEMLDLVEKMLKEKVKRQ